MRAGFLTLAVMTLALSGFAGAESAKPVPARTCADVKAWLDQDGTIAQETFKQLMITMGYKWNPVAEQNFAGHCNLAARKVTVHEHQQLWPTSIVFSAKVVDDKGVCRLTEVSLSQCDLLGDLRNRAESGDIRAMVELGNDYYKPQGIEQNYAEAMKWFRRAAELGDAEGMYDLGVMYGKGAGVPMNPAEALAWYKRAAEAGNATAMYNLGITYGVGIGVPKDMTTALKWFRLAAEKGDGEAMEKLGEVYATGRGGIPVDYPEAAKWFQKAGEHGDLDAMVYLSTFYHVGRGVAQDDLQAYYWASMGTMGGNRSAQAQRDALKHALPADKLTNIDLRVAIDWIKFSANKLRN